MAKKVIALVAAMVLVVCFAVIASAEVNVATTTTYVDAETVKVNVTVTGVDEDANVTYYATKGGANVHIDQEKATDAGATFEFDTDVTNLDSAVKVGYTDAEKAENAAIDCYTVAYPGGSKVVPTETTTITFPYTLGQYKEFDTVTVSGDATVSASEYAEGNVTVIFSAINGNITLSVVEKDAPIGTPTVDVEAIDAGAVLVAPSTDPNYQGGIKIDGVKEGLGEFDPDIEDEQVIASANADKKDDRKLTVVGKATVDGEYGIIVSETAIDAGSVRKATFDSLYAGKTYAGVTKDSNGIFAIQLIDTSALDSADAFVKSNTSYYTAVYAYDKGIEAYVISTIATAVVAK